MSKKILLIAVVTLCVVAISQVHGQDIWEQETFTNGFWGLNDSLAASGIESGLWHN